MRHYWLFSCLLGLYALPALAGSPARPAYPYSAQYQKCVANSANEMTSLMCVSDEHEKWDARLNKAWQAALKTRQNAPAWRQAQRTWITFRDRQCNIYNFADNGSGDKTLSEICLLNMTIERTLQLEDDNWPAS